jgi:exonuclease III
MKIATYNIRNLYDAGTFIDERAENAVHEDLFNTRVAHFSSLFKERNVDVICLQEVGGEEGIKKIAENIGYEYVCAKPNKRGIRVAVLYKKEHNNSIQTESLSLGDLHLPAIQKKGDTDSVDPIAQRRDVLVIDIKKEGKRSMRIVTFHLKSLIPTYLEGENEEEMNAHSDAKFRSVLYKMMELRALRSYTTKSIQEGYDVVLLGDFNEHNNSSGIDILKSSMLDDYRLYDVTVGYAGDKTTHIHRGNKITFDTILVSNGLKDSYSQVIIYNEGLKDYSTLPPGDIEYVVEADHAMVSVSID